MISAVEPLTHCDLRCNIAKRVARRDASYLNHVSAYLKWYQRSRFHAFPFAAQPSETLFPTSLDRFPIFAYIQAEFTRQTEAPIHRKSYATEDAFNIEMPTSGVSGSAGQRASKMNMSASGLSNLRSVAASSSRSSHHATGPSSKGPSDPTIVSTDSDAQRIFVRLKAVGMPEGVTFEGFLRLYHSGISPDLESHDTKGKRKEHEQERLGGRSGANSRARTVTKGAEETTLKHRKWKEALEVLGAQLIGRAEVQRAREVIVHAREEVEKSKSRIKAPTAYPGTRKDVDLLADPIKVAESNRESASRVLGSLKKEWDIESAKTAALDRKKRELNCEIDEKRKTLLLLEVLEKRENLNVLRIGTNGLERSVGIGDLLKALRFVVSSSLQLSDTKWTQGRKPNRPSSVLKMFWPVIRRSFLVHL